MSDRNNSNIFCLAVILLGLILIGLGIYLITINFISPIIIGTILAGLLLLISCCQRFRFRLITCLLIVIVTLFLIISGINSIITGSIVVGLIMIGLGVITLLLSVLCFAISFSNEYYNVKFHDE